MSNIRVAKRYAEGLWDYALSVKEEETIVKEAYSIIEIVKESKDFRLFLSSPIIETEKKISIAEEIFKSFSKTSQNFITIILKHKRESDLLDIAKQIIALNDIHKGIQRVTITSAYQLDDEMIAKIISKNKLDESKVVVENKLDESIIGGYILHVEDYQLDASVKTQLETIKTQFQEKVF